MKANIEKEFIEACEIHSDALFRFCYFKVSDREVAKDLIQDTFMKTWGYMARGEKIDNIRALFYKILGNLIIDYYRKKKAVSLDTLAEKGFDPSFDEKEVLENKFDGENALILLNQIPDMYKDLIMMRYIQDLSLAEIASITNEPQNTIAVKIHRGLKKVKEIFQEKTHTHYE